MTPASKIEKEVARIIAIHNFWRGKYIGITWNDALVAARAILKKYKVVVRNQKKVMHYCKHRRGFGMTGRCRSCALMGNTNRKKK